MCGCWLTYVGRTSQCLMMLPPDPTALLELVSCGCRTGCASNRCSCHHAGLLCASACSCNNCANGHVQAGRSDTVQAAPNEYAEESEDGSKEEESEHDSPAEEDASEEEVSSWCFFIESEPVNFFYQHFFYMHIHAHAHELSHMHITSVDKHTQQTNQQTQTHSLTHSLPLIMQYMYFHTCTLFGIRIICKKKQKIDKLQAFWRMRITQEALVGAEELLRPSFS